MIQVLNKTMKLNDIKSMVWKQNISEGAIVKLKTSIQTTLMSTVNTSEEENIDH